MGTTYQIRKAAGTYWLLDMEQAGPAFQRPVPLNESGASIWQLLEEGKKPEQIAQIFVEEYGISCHEASADIRQFMEQLEKQGINMKWKYY